MDPIHGIRGKQRSVHNTHFTLPVLFAMLSNHYASPTPPANWLVLILMMFAGAKPFASSGVMRHGCKSWAAMATAAVCAGGRCTVIVGGHGVDAACSCFY